MPVLEEIENKDPDEFKSCSSKHPDERHQEPRSFAEEAQQNADSARKQDQQRRENFALADKIVVMEGLQELGLDESFDKAPSNFSSAFS